MRGESVAERIAQFVSTVDYGDLPGNVVERLRVHFLDTLGSMLLGVAQPWNRVVRDYAVRESPVGLATVVGVEQGCRPEWAALANGTCAEGFESDDYHSGAGIHPGAITVPAALATMEDVRSNDEELLTSLAMGYELAIRIGMAGAPGMTYGRSVHVTSAVGPLGAALVASKLRHLSATQMSNALGIAASHSGGPLEYTQSGGEVKRIHAGIAGMAGIRAASLAEHGLTAPPTIFEGPRGFYKVFSANETIDFNALTADLGSKWALLDSAIKPYFACAGILAPLRAIHEMISEDGLIADDVASITVGLDRQALSLVGTIGPYPKQMQEAQFSVHFSIGLALATGGNAYEQYAAAQLSDFGDPVTRSIAERVKVKLDDEANARYPDVYSARVTVVRNLGAPLSRYVDAPGTGRNAMSFEQVRRKFRQVGAMTLDPSDLNDVEEAVARLPNRDSVLTIIQRFRGAGRQSPGVKRPGRR